MSRDLTAPPEDILIVDDEPRVREVIRRILTRAGFSCSVAASSDEAWGCLQLGNVDLVTLDVDMPGLSGLELLEKIHEQFSDVSVIMLTAIGGADTAIRALNHGACGFLTKPVQQEELLLHVRRGLERRQMILERRSHTENLETRVREQTLAIRRAHEETIHRMVAASMYRDEETGAHIKRVGLSSAVLAKAANWSLEGVERIRLAAPMHDVGKIGIPDDILRKPGNLTEDEFALMKLHTLIGAELLKNSESPMLQMAHQIALYHHERWDGTGYPNGLRETAIPESARIVAIADVYDALTHDRIYRPAMSHERALEILAQGRGTHFDPNLLDLFFSELSEFRRISQENPDEWIDPLHGTASLARSQMWNPSFEAAN